MHPWHHGLLLLHLATVMAGAVVVVAAGRYTARRTRQPEVIGEIAAGMLTGPLLLWALGADRFHTALQLTATLHTADGQEHHGSLASPHHGGSFRAHPIYRTLFPTG
jgi:Kef-type K+ transport system membrane component KefB